MVAGQICSPIYTAPSAVGWSPSASRQRRATTIGFVGKLELYRLECPLPSALPALVRLAWGLKQDLSTVVLGCSLSFDPSLLQH